MGWTGIPIEDVDFDSVNVYRARIAKRLPAGFIMAVSEAIVNGDTLVDYETRKGNRLVARITKEGENHFVDFMVNPDLD